MSGRHAATEAGARRSCRTPAIILLNKHSGQNENEHPLSYGNIYVFSVFELQLQAVFGYEVRLGGETNNIVRREDRLPAPANKNVSNGETHMRKLTVLAVALGFLATSALPTIAAPASNDTVNSYELSAAKKKAAKKKAAPKAKKKKSELTTTDFSAAKKKAAKKKAAPKAKKKTSEIVYRIAA